MNIEDILNKLDETIEEAWSVPLSQGRRVVDASRVQELIDDIRLNVPTEIRQARAIVGDRNDIIKDARKEAEVIVERARKKASMLVEESEVLREATKKATEILDTANKNANEVKRISATYSEKILKVSEEQMAKSIYDLRQAITQIKNLSNK